MLAVLAVTLVVGLATGLGTLPFFFGRGVGRRLYDTILGAGAGLMLAAATLGLLNAALHGEEIAEAFHGSTLARLALVLVGLLLGLLSVSVMDRWIPHVHARGHGDHLHGDHLHQDSGAVHAHSHDEHPAHVHGHADASGPLAGLVVDPAARRADLLLRRAGMLVGALAIHRIPEGLAIGAAYAIGSGQRLGMVLAIAIGAQNICEGVVMSAPLRHAGLSAFNTLVRTAATGLLLPLAAVAGFAAGRALFDWIPGALAFAAGALLYVAFNEVIPESHSHGNERYATFGLAVGLSAVVTLQTLLGH
jgi:ZIP family zinc transporter